MSNTTTTITANWRSWEMDPQFMLRKEFLRDVLGDTLSSDTEFGLEHSGVDFLDAVSAVMTAETGDHATITTITALHHIISVAGVVQAQIIFDGKKDLTRQSRGHFTVCLAGQRDVVLRLRKELRNQLGAGKLPTITWQFSRGDSAPVGARHIVMEPPKPVYDQFYPFLDGGVESFLDRYMADNASILFLAGIPGTGKTSLIRHLIYSRALAATITFDTVLLERDGLFVDFLCADEDGILLIEDADTMLGSRESEGNKLISRFLNISDGLVKMARKKIVFTTNLGDFSKVDPALIRAGRCFGAIKFRSLTVDEAGAAARAAGLPAPDREVTLAELFNQAHEAPIEMQQIGF